MNFGDSIKKEILSRFIKDDCCRKAFLAGLIRGTGTLIFNDGDYSLEFFLKSEDLAFTVTDYLKSLFDYDVNEVLISEDRLNKKDRFALSVNGDRAVEILKELEILKEVDGEVIVNLKFYGELTKKECCLKAFIRGLFVSCGACTVPSKSYSGNTRYHLEISFSHKEPADDTASVLAEHGVMTKVINRKEGYITYIKSLDEIKNFTAFLPAPVSVLKLMDLIVENDFLNKINRQKNCDLGNLTRQVEASAKQIDAINKIKNVKGLQSLKKDLLQTANARLEFPDDTLPELAERLNVTKSCLHHRLRKLVAIASEID